MDAVDSLGNYLFRRCAARLEAVRLPRREIREQEENSVDIGLVAQIRARRHYRRGTGRDAKAERLPGAASFRGDGGLLNPPPPPADGFSAVCHPQAEYRTADPGGNGAEVTEQS